ncbi:MAG: hypothetical protein J6J36_05850 [Clostridia bacterium]|nr:hypothetical protein [Clostridia bacterium]
MDTANSTTNQSKKITTQEIDQIIHSYIDIALLKVKDLCEIKKFKSHVDERRRILKYFFKEFDENMEIIEFRGNMYTIVKVNHQSKNNWEEILDRIIKRRISENLDSLYSDIDSRRSSNTFSEKFLSQIIDRNIRVSSLLENFDNNMQALNKHKKNYDCKMELNLNDSR